MQFDKDKIITYTVIGVAVIGLLFLTLSSTGQFTGKTDKSFGSAIDNHNFNYNSDFDGDGVSDFDECPELGSVFKEFSNVPEFVNELGNDKIEGFAVFEGGGMDSPKPIIINGCTDKTAINYNSKATVDDGSCEYEDKEEEKPTEDLPSDKVRQVLALNCPDSNGDGIPDWADPNFPKSSPEPTDLEGCTDSEAENYNSKATVDDGSCEYMATIPTTPVLRWSAPYEFNVDQCKVTLNNGIYEGQALIIIQISSGSDIKKYSYEPINLVQSQQVVIETTSPNGWDSTYECEIFLWEDFSGKPISSWKYAPQNVGTLPSTPGTLPGDGTINQPINPVSGGLNPFT